MPLALRLGSALWKRSNAFPSTSGGIPGPVVCDLVKRPGGIVCGAHAGAGMGDGVFDQVGDDPPQPARDGVDDHLACVDVRWVGPAVGSRGLVIARLWGR